MSFNNTNPNTTKNNVEEATKSIPPQDTLSVGIHTLGCRLNQYESDGIIGKFGNHHYKIVPFSEGPDIAIINTCTVTESADSKNRNIVRQVLKRNPNAKVFVTGCYAQTDPEKLIGIRGVRAVVGNDRKSHLFDIIEEMLKDDASIELSTKQLSDGAIENVSRGKRRIVRDPFGYGKVFPVGHSRAYLKIQDGCDRKCSYCKIPQARGGGVSRELEEVIDHLTQIDEAKIPEIVLTGVNLGWYRQNEIRFTDLLLTMLDRLQYSRIRLSSIEPSDVSERLAELSLHPRFCNYLHVPVQSGSAKILRLMKRSYTPETFRKRIEKVRSINSNLYLGTDVMVGFPGETDQDFEDTMSLLTDLEIAGVHPFPFSPRSGTVAADMKERVHGTIVKDRVNRLLNHKEQAIEKFYRKMDSCIVEGAVEATTKIEKGREFMEAITGEYLRLWVPVTSDYKIQTGSLVKLKLLADQRIGIPVD